MHAEGAISVQDAQQKNVVSVNTLRISLSMVDQAL